jgi:NAD(P)-dependent dehydrogenase (short-subunit alcohol dehydrogenase family)
MMTSLNGKVAVVTGGSSGIGREIAIRLSRAGACVVVASRNAEPRSGEYGESGDVPVVDLIQSQGGEAYHHRTDVTQASDHDSLAAEAVRRFGSLDIWVNNAGAMPFPKGFCDYSEDELDFLLSTNTKGVWHGTRAAANEMRRAGNGGSIINVLSTAAIRPHPNQSIYNVSKAAAAQATRCAALEFGPDRIRVNGVCPTVVKTAASRPFIESPYFEQWFKTIATLGSALDPGQVADAILYLAGDMASAVTGIMLPVDSGEALGPPATALPGA